MDDEAREDTEGESDGRGVNGRDVVDDEFDANVSEC